MARGAVPLYFLIESALRDRIRSGQYPAAAPFPTEEALRKEFSVSRGTVRLALDSLRRDGLIVSHPGRGAVVTDLSDRPRTLRFAGSFQELIAWETEVEFRVLDYGIADAGPTEAAELRLQDSRRTMRVTGIRLVGQQIVAHVTIAMPEPLGALLRLGRGEDSPPIVAQLVGRLGQTIREVHQVIAVALADEASAAVLGVPAASPVLQIRRTYLTAGGTPVEYAVSSYPADRYQYESTISTWSEHPAPALNHPAGGL